MSRFQLVITPDGRSMLTTPEPITASEAAHIRLAFERWQEDHSTLIVPDAEIVRVLDIELDPAIEPAK